MPMKVTYAERKARGWVRSRSSLSVGQKKVRNRRRKEVRKLRCAKLIEDAKAVPCADCGGEFPHCCMQFDHVPERGTRDFGITIGFNSSIQMLIKEIAKCDVVCANCHCLRTFFRSEELWQSASL